MGVLQAKPPGRSRLRALIGLLYALSTAVLPALHDHDAFASRSPQALEDCIDAGLHWAGHTDAPDLSHIDHHCIACQDRIEPLASADVRLDLVILSSDRPVEWVTAAGQRFFWNHSTRGPPRS